MANEPSKTPTQATPQMIPLSKLHELPFLTRNRRTSPVSASDKMKENAEEKM